VALISHHHLAPRLKKEWNCTSTPFPCLHGKLYLLKLCSRRKLFCYLWMGLSNLILLLSEFRNSHSTSIFCVPSTSFLRLMQPLCKNWGIIYSHFTHKFLNCNFSLLIEFFRSCISPWKWTISRNRRDGKLESLLQSEIKLLSSWLIRCTSTSWNKFFREYKLDIAWNVAWQFWNGAFKVNVWTFSRLLNEVTKLTSLTV
jgi:hypothetical protein